MIIPYNKQSFETLKKEVQNHLSSYKYDHYQHYPATDGKAWQQYFFQRLETDFKNQEYVFFYEKAHTFPFLLGCRISKWDEDHFGFKMAIINWCVSFNVEDNQQVIHNLIKDCTAYLKSVGVKFITARIHGDNIRVLNQLEKNGFRYIENIVWPVTHCEKKQFKLDDRVREIKESDLSYLIEIAKVFQYQRGHYHCDDKFDRKKVDSMYAKWLKSSWENKEKIAVFEYNKKPVGYFVFKMDKRLSKALGYSYGRLMSLAIDGNLRGKGIGIKLFTSTLALIANLGGEIIDSGYATKNHLSSRLHVQNSFYSVYEEVTLHLWL